MKRGKVIGIALEPTKDAITEAVKDKRWGDIFKLLKMGALRPFVVLDILYHRTFFGTHYYSEEEAQKYAICVMRYASDPKYWTKERMRPAWDSWYAFAGELAIPHIPPPCFSNHYPDITKWSARGMYFRSKSYGWVVIRRQCDTFFLVLLRMRIAMPKDLRVRLERTIAAAQVFWWQAFEESRTMKLGTLNKKVDQSHSTYELARPAFIDQRSAHLLARYPIHDTIYAPLTRNQQIRTAVQTNNSTELVRLFGLSVQWKHASVSSIIVTRMHQSEDALFYYYDVCGDLIPFATIFSTFTCPATANGLNLLETLVKGRQIDVSTFAHTDRRTIVQAFGLSRGAHLHNLFGVMLRMGMYPLTITTKISSNERFQWSGYIIYVYLRFLGWMPRKAHASQLPPFFKQRALTLMLLFQRKGMVNPEWTTRVIKDVAAETVLDDAVRFYLYTEKRPNKEACRHKLRLPTNSPLNRSALIDKLVELFWKRERPTLANLHASLRNFFASM